MLQRAATKRWGESLLVQMGRLSRVGDVCPRLHLCARVRSVLQQGCDAVRVSVEGRNVERRRADLRAKPGGKLTGGTAGGRYFGKSTGG